MSKKKLIMLSASSRLKKDPIETIPAIERYDGIFFRLLRKYLREGKLRNTDILIVSEKFGLLWSNDKIPFHEPFPGKYGSLSLDKNAIEKLRRNNLQKLSEILGQYSHIYVNLGSGYKKLIENFENLTKGKVIFARGKGIGPKASHMKEWILSNA